MVTLTYSQWRTEMEQEIQNQVSLLIGKYGWLFIVGVLTLLFRSTIEKFVAGLMVFMGNDYNEDDVVEVDGKPGRIVRVGMWTTTFFTYDVRDGIIVGGSKLVVQNDKLKDIKIEKPLPLLDLSKYKVDTTCNELLTELTKLQKDKK
jgi:hypothetical protein|tara:strand:- start:63 stop:503 length:441 start_codon:yes stop_codon:yes gene_type:complete